MARPRTLIAALSLGMTLLFAGCGSDDPPKSSSKTTTSAAQATTTTASAASGACKILTLEAVRTVLPTAKTGAPQKSGGAEGCNYIGGTTNLYFQHIPKAVVAKNLEERGHETLRDSFATAVRNDPTSNFTTPAAVKEGLGKEAFSVAGRSKGKTNGTAAVVWLLGGDEYTIFLIGHKGTSSATREIVLTLARDLAPTL